MYLTEQKKHQLARLMADEGRDYCAGVLDTLQSLGVPVCERREIYKLAIETELNNKEIRAAKGIHY